MQVRSSSQLVQLGELPRKSKVKQTHQFAFCLERHSDDVGLPCSIPQPHATLGAYEPPSCSVNRPSCPGCVTKTPGFVHNKSRNIQQRTNPSPWMCVRWSRQQKATLSSQVSMAKRTQGPADLYNGKFKAGRMMGSPYTVHLASQLQCSAASEPTGHTALFQGIQVWKLQSKTYFPLLPSLLLFIETFFIKKMLYFCIIFIPSRIFALIYFGAGF